MAVSVTYPGTRIPGTALNCTHHQTHNTLWAQKYQVNQVVENFDIYFLFIFWPFRSIKPFSPIMTCPWLWAPAVCHHDFITFRTTSKRHPNHQHLHVSVWSFSFGGSKVMIAQSILRWYITIMLLVVSPKFWFLFFRKSLLFVSSTIFQIFFNSWNFLLWISAQVFLQQFRRILKVRDKVLSTTVTMYFFGCRHLGRTLKLFTHPGLQAGRVTRSVRAKWYHQPEGPWLGANLRVLGWVPTWGSLVGCQPEGPWLGANLRVLGWVQGSVSHDRSRPFNIIVIFGRWSRSWL